SPPPGSAERNGAATGNTRSSDTDGTEARCPPHVLVARPSRLLASCSRAARSSSIDAAGSTPVTASPPRPQTEQLPPDPDRTEGDRPPFDIEHLFEHNSHMTPRS